MHQMKQQKTFISVIQRVMQMELNKKRKELNDKDKTKETAFWPFFDFNRACILNKFIYFKCIIKNSILN